MKKLFAMVLVLGLVSVASAAPVLSFTPQVDGVVGAAGGYAVDILATDLTDTAGMLLVSTGELGVVATGGVTITSVAGLTYQGAGDTNMFWSDAFSTPLAALDGATHARVGLSYVGVNTLFMLALDDLCIEDIMINWDGTVGSLSIVPNNQPQSFGNSGWYDGTTAGTDREALGGTIEFVPEPITLSLLALGGLGMIRRRR